MQRNFVNAFSVNVPVIYSRSSTSSDFVSNQLRLDNTYQLDRNDGVLSSCQNLVVEDLECVLNSTINMSEISVIDYR